LLKGGCYWRVQWYPPFSFARTPLAAEKFFAGQGVPSEALFKASEFLNA